MAKLQFWNDNIKDVRDVSANVHRSYARFDPRGRWSFTPTSVVDAYFRWPDLAAVRPSITEANDLVALANNAGASTKMTFMSTEACQSFYPTTTSCVPSS